MKNIRWTIFFFCFLSKLTIEAQDTLFSPHHQIIIMDSILAEDRFVHTYYPLHQQNRDTAAMAVFPEMYYEFRIEQLNKETPIPLYYDSLVLHYIQLYLTKRRNELEKIIGLSELYFPLFEEALDRHQLPFEFKYLAIVESGLNPLAVSSSGAVGLWQLLLNAGKMFDLEVNSYIDERSDPYKSTGAACRYMVYLHDVFNDWQLVLASYNGGPGEIRKAIHASGGKLNYRELQPYLPTQTKNYVPAFIAMVYLMNNYQHHGIHPKLPPITYAGTDTLYVSYQVSFSQISNALDIDEATLRFLNPQYKHGIIPESSTGRSLVLPARNIQAYLAYQHKIYARAEEKDNYFTLLDNASNTEGRQMIVHIVKKGEFFHKIAMNYGCTMEQLKAWNELDDNFLYPGQELKIWLDKSINKDIEASLTREEGYHIYQVQPGDNLYQISSRYRGVNVEVLRKVNNLDHSVVLKPGMELKVPAY